LEEILPLNYFSELCGIMVDMTIILFFIKKYFPKTKLLFSNKMLENSVVNFINKNLIGLFTEFLKEKTSLLIWDYLFLEGNIILIKSFIAIINTLKKNLYTIKSDEDIIALKETLDKSKEINEDDLSLLQTLIIRQYEFNAEDLDKYRYQYSIYFAENLENGNLEQIQCKLRTDYNSRMKMMESKYKNCNKNWPYCLNDTYFETVTNVIDYLVINHKNKCKVVDNYFFANVNNNDINIKNKENDNKNNKNKINNKYDEDYYNIALERRPHYCSEIIEELQKERNNINNNNNNNRINQINSNEKLNSSKDFSEFDKTEENFSNI
jgi:hypothetical protein